MKAYREARQEAHEKIRAIVRRHRRAWHARGITAHMTKNSQWEFRRGHRTFHDDPWIIEWTYNWDGKAHFQVRSHNRWLGYYRLAEDMIEEHLPVFIDAVFGWGKIVFPEVAYYNQWEDYP